MLREGLSVGELRGMLRLKQAEAAQRVAEEQGRLERVEARLRLIEKEGRMPEQEVVVKVVPEVRGLGMRAKVAGPPGIAEFFGDGFAALGMAGVTLAGPPLSVYHDPEFSPDSIDVELVCPVAPGVKGPLPTPAGRTLEPRTVPGGEVAVIVHVGPFDDGGRGLPGPGGLDRAARLPDERAAVREIYLTAPTDPGPPVTEIRWPVEKE